MSTNETHKDMSIEVPKGELGLRGGVATLWGYANFAEQWFVDARAEALSETSRDSVRREIVFSVCFLESYIFEWVRSLDLHLVTDFFPPEPRFNEDPRFRRELKEKWKLVPQELYSEGHIPAEPRLDLSQLGALLKYRHGLVHAVASRPFNADAPESHRPIPDPNDFNQIKAGWALDIAAILVAQLHKTTLTDGPSYVEEWLAQKK